jgi:hypothetical protein
MTTDERLDRLTERHEALTLSVELLTHEMQKLTELSIAAQKERDQDAENIRALARIAELHHERLSRLEGTPE